MTLHLVVNAFILGSAPASITLGNTTGNNNSNYGANNMQGRAFQATSSGIINFLNILGRSDTASAQNFRLVLYAATDATTWGAKLAETVQLSGLGINETKKSALSVPVSIVLGNWYAPCIHPAGNMGVRSDSVNNGRFFADTYSDGSLATAPATSNLGPSPIIWGTTD